MTWLETLLDEPFVCITDMLRRFGKERGEHPALICGGEVVSYTALDARVDRFAAALQRDGIQPRDAIALCASASVDYAVAFLGGLRAGAAVAPLAPSSSAASLVSMIGNSDARLLFVDAEVKRLLEPVAAEIGAVPIALDAHPGSTALAAWLAPQGATPAAVPIDPAWPFNIIYSSGTTGTPKGIVQSHGMRWAYAVRSIQRGYGPDATTLISTPLYSNTTLVSFMPTLTFGGTVVLMPKFEATRYLELAQQYRATHTMLVPVQYQRLMAHPDFDRYDLSSFQAKFCTSTPFAASIKADVVRRWPGRLTEYYGMTEGGGSCQLEADEWPTKLHSVGRPMDGHDIRLIDELGNEVAAGEVGEIVGHSPAMMTGYYRQPDKTAQAQWYDPSGKRFIRTGDMGRFDEDGFLTLLDRKKDMIISGGFNVYPSDLEAQVSQHPEVTEVACSVLCPYFVPTGIAQAHRNRPSELANDTPPTLSQRVSRALSEKAVSSGKISAQEVAAMVFDAVRDEQFYIFSHPHALGAVKTRSEDIVSPRNPTDPFVERPHVREQIIEALKG